MDDRWTTWQAEQAGPNRLPSIWSVFLLFGALALALIVALGGPDAVAQDRDRGSLCQEHRGRPGWDSVCREAVRR